MDVLKEVIKLIAIMVSYIGLTFLVRKCSGYSERKSLQFTNDGMKLMPERKNSYLKWDDIYCIHAEDSHAKGMKVYEVEMKNEKLRYFRAESSYESEIYKHYLEYLKNNVKKPEYRFSARFLNNTWLPLKCLICCLIIIGLVILLLYWKWPNSQFLPTAIACFIIYCPMVLFGFYKAKKRRAMIDGINYLTENLHNGYPVKLAENGSFFRASVLANTDLNLFFIEYLSCWPMLREEIMIKQEEPLDIVGEE
jgi:hypothetical protein